MLKYSESKTFVKTETLNSGVIYVNIWKALFDSTFYDKYATIFDQVKINNIKVQIRPFTYHDTPAYVLTAAFDRNGLSETAVSMTEPKI